MTAGGEIAREQLVGRLAGALKVEAAEAEARVEELVAAGCCRRPPDAGRVAVTEAGAEVHGRVRGAIDEITTRLWGDLPADGPGDDRADPHHDPRAGQRSVR